MRGSDGCELRTGMGGQDEERGLDSGDLVGTGGIGSGSC